MALNICCIRVYSLRLQVAPALLLLEACPFLSRSVITLAEAMSPQGEAAHRLPARLCRLLRCWRDRLVTLPFPFRFAASPRLPSRFMTSPPRLPLSRPPGPLPRGVDALGPSPCAQQASGSNRSATHRSGSCLGRRRPRFASTPRRRGWGGGNAGDAESLGPAPVASDPRAG